ncbi:MAG: hypothetical protein GF332_01140 [Candidatus Moranbacteria bacterium]|nr:hypothetical protein [Candidatus Moranbacteria bacterium]
MIPLFILEFACLMNFSSKPFLALAPMAGITDSAFRLICRENGADLVYSEMANVSALYHRSAKTLELLKFSQAERPYIIQLFGKEPKHFTYAAQLLSKKGAPQINYRNPKRQLGFQPPDGLDINFGCPAKKVFNNGSGLALWLQPKLAQKIIRSVVQSTRLPVSIKTRIGLEIPERLRQTKNILDLPDFLKSLKINELGLSSIMLHGRTYKQGFTGPINYQAILRAKQYFSGTILANGNIKTPKIAEQTLKETQAQGLGIATGAYGQPEIFKLIKKRLDLTKPDPKLFTESQDKNRQGRKLLLNFLDQKITLALRHAHYVDLLKPTKGIIQFRKHLLWYFKGLPDIKKLYPLLTQVQTFSQVKSALAQIKKTMIKQKNFINGEKSIG